VKSLFTLLLSFLFFGVARAQLLKVSDGTDLTKLAGTIFNADGLTLIPSNNFTINNNTLNKSAVLIHASSRPTISKLYQFIKSTNSYSSAVQFSNTDGTKLNCISENDLRISVHNGKTWIVYPNTT
jgi:hypothetical protein